MSLCKLYFKMLLTITVDAEQCDTHHTKLRHDVAIQKTPVP